MRLHAFTCGWLEAALGNFLDGEPGRLRVPVPCFLIDHPRGAVLFDSGLHPQTQTDAEGRYGPVARIFKVAFAAGEELAARLAAVGVEATRVRWLINSHLHFDHTGGNAQVPNARLVVQRREWEAGHDAEQIARQFYFPHDYQLGHDTLLVSGEHDLFGDGRVVCLPTPGHTPGHQSLRVRLDAGEVVLTADACYLRRTLEQLHLPPVVDDAEQMRASLRRLAALRAAGARLIFGHDPDDWATVPAVLG